MTEKLTLVGAHQRAFREPSFMKTNEYIHAVLFSQDLYSLELEMGPNCNLSCAPCLANCGPHKKGLPNPRTVEKAINDGLVSGVISGCTLTNGEALREENREVVGVVAGASRYLPIHILTNGVFAGSLESAVEWFTFLKKSGMDFSHPDLIGKATEGYNFMGHPGNEWVAPTCSSIQGLETGRKK